MRLITTHIINAYFWDRKCADAADLTCKRILKEPQGGLLPGCGYAILDVKGPASGGDMLTALLITAILAVVITGLVILSAMQDLRDDY